MMNKLLETPLFYILKTPVCYNTLEFLKYKIKVFLKVCSSFSFYKMNSMLKTCYSFYMLNFKKNTLFFYTQTHISVHFFRVTIVLCMR